MQQKDFAKKKSLELFGISEFGREKVSLMPGGRSITKNFRYC